MAQKLESVHCEGTLFTVDDQPELPQPRENLVKMVHVGLEVHTGHSQIIQIAVGEREACLNTVHHPLKTAARVTKTERHPPELEEAKSSDDGRLLPVLRPHRDLPVSLAEVDLEKTVQPLR
jgi:hypothetical protein